MREGGSEDVQDLRSSMGVHTKQGMLYPLTMGSNFRWTNRVPRDTAGQLVGAAEGRPSIDAADLSSSTSSRSRGS